MIQAYCDGACRVGNPGICSASWLVELPGGAVSQGYFLGKEVHTNNFAEYWALIYLLEYLEKHNWRNVLIHCDSKLVVEQVNQRWNVINTEIRPLMSKAYGLLVRGCHVLKHVKGHSGNAGNEFVDRLCNKVLDDNEVPRGSNWNETKAQGTVSVA